MMAVEFTKLKLNDALDQSIALVQYVAREKSIDLENVPLPEPTWVWADGDLLRQAVLNLLSNALKYTPIGGKVTLTAGQSSDGPSYWVRVADTGVGIAGDELDRVFDKFYRSYNGRQLSGGTGLGLSLVKHVVEQIHGGRIEVDSQPGHGSTFTLYLPVQPAAPARTDPNIQEEASVA
jgi:two-component system, OmpR family, phosphate regulon sensor histidine kinase PhoR